MKTFWMRDDDPTRYATKEECENAPPYVMPPGSVWWRGKRLPNGEMEYTGNDPIIPLLRATRSFGSY